MKLISESFAGLATAASRAIEWYSPAEKRLFDDRLALDLLALGWRMIIRLLFLPGLRHAVLALRERRFPGLLGALLCRTRYIDDVLQQSLADGVAQVVILGVGFDSRAYRITGMDQVHVFEVDLPGSVRLKQARVKNVLGVLPGHVTWVGIDFDRQQLPDVLPAAGFERGKQTLFIWEGVTQYITVEAVDATLRFVASAGGAGSAIVFTYIRQGVIDGTACSAVERRIAAFAGKVGSPWIFGFDPAALNQYLAARGLKLIADIGAAEHRAQRLAPLGRTMQVFDGERVALARVMAGAAA